MLKYTNSNISQAERAAIHYLRVFALVCILICHILEAYNISLSSIFYVGVPIFFTISAHLYGKKNITLWKSWIINRIIKIFVPLWIFIIPVILLFLLFYPSEIKIPYIILHILGLQGFIECPYGLNHLWFITAILVCYVTIPVLQQLKRHAKLMTFLCYIILFIDFDFYNCRFYWLPLYLIAYFQSNTSKGCLYAFIGLITSFFIINEPQQRHIALRCLTGLTLTEFSLFIFNKTCTTYIIPSIKTISYHSYTFYLVHNFIIIGSFSLIHFSSLYYLNLILIISISIFFTYLFQKVSDLSTTNLFIKIF